MSPVTPSDQKIHFGMSIKDNWLAALAVTFLAVVSMLLAMQGWGGGVVGFDLIPHAMDAERFLATGDIPSHGCLSSLGSYIPPGTSWLLIPGELLFIDSRLGAVPGAFILHVLAIAGVYRLGRWCWTGRVGLFAATVFAFSPVALGAAFRMWPCARFPMAATIWATYFLCRWAYDKKATGLGAALVVVVLGLYIHLEGMLLIGVIPLLWLVFKPPVRLNVVLVALVAGLLVWWPFLRFESARDFVDLKSQLGQHSIVYDKATVSQVNRLAVEYGLPQLDVAKPSAFAPGAMPLKARILGKADVMAQNLVNAILSVGGNFKSYKWGEVAALVLSVVMLAYLLIVGLPLVRNCVPSPVKGALQQCALIISRNRRSLAVAGVVAVLVALVANERVLGWVLSSDGIMESYTIRPIRLFQAVLVVVGVGLVASEPLIRWLEGATRGPVSRPAVLAVVFGVPWLIMAMLAAPDVPYRYWNFWPVQVVVLAGMVALAIEHWGRGGKQLRVFSLAAVLIVMTANTAVIERVRAWHQEGYHGDSDEVIALRGLAEMIRADGIKVAAIGYAVPFSPYMAYYRVFDEAYKVGLPYDWQLKSAYGITNRTTTPSGLSSTDRYRFVSSRPLSGNYIRLDVEYGPEWTLAGKCGEYSWWRKTGE